MNTNKREEKILLELEDYVRAEKRRSDSSTYIYGQGESNAFEKVLKKISELTTSLPQNGDREKEACLHEVIGIDYDPANKPHGYCMSDGCKRAFNIGSFPPSPSEGKEKEPKEWVEIDEVLGKDKVQEVAVWKETAPTTDWEERFESIKIQCADDSENHNREIKAFIQTLLKEKDEEFVKEIEKVVDEWNSLEEMDEENAVSLVVTKLIAKYSPEGREE